LAGKLLQKAVIGEHPWGFTAAVKIFPLTFSRSCDYELLVALATGVQAFGKLPQRRLFFSTGSLAAQENRHSPKFLENME